MMAIVAFLFFAGEERKHVHKHTQKPHHKTSHRQILIYTSMWQPWQGVVSCHRYISSPAIIYRQLAMDIQLPPGIQVPSIIEGSTIVTTMNYCMIISSVMTTSVSNQSTVTITNSSRRKYIFMTKITMKTTLNRIHPMILTMTIPLIVFNTI